jgi:hypothetical protein
MLMVATVGRRRSLPSSSVVLSFIPFFSRRSDGAGPMILPKQRRTVRLGQSRRRVGEEVANGRIERKEVDEAESQIKKKTKKHYILLLEI